MKRWAYVVAAVVLGYGLTGCTGHVDDPPASDPPPTPTIAPTPEWNAEEQGAIDAVQTYLATWAYIGQNLVEADWNSIRDVSSDPESNHDLMVWTHWAENEWHLVGKPEFTPLYLTWGAVDYQGQRYHVYGCFVIEDSYIADDAGNSVGDSGRVERGVNSYTVIQTPDDLFLILDSKAEDDTC
ncbi:MAG: hypothetical protein FWD75_04420 [Propionibacteriaceae bacterium]|nr:hypothetical protein [Propionibacteriaceae bacterium]